MYVCKTSFQGMIYSHVPKCIPILYKMKFIICLHEDGYKERADHKRPALVWDIDYAAFRLLSA